MALPAELAPISPSLVKAGVRLGSAFRPDGEGGLPLGLEALDRAMPDGGLLRGGVVELAVNGPSGLVTSLALAAVRAVARQAESVGARALCAFVDPSGTLYAPGVAAHGVELDQLLVVRPSPEAIGRVAIKLAESALFPLIVVDTLGTLGASLDVPLGPWGRVVRRLSMAVDGTPRTVVLLTDAKQPRALPLPVAQRLEVTRIGVGKLGLRVAKDRRGRISGAREIAYDQCVA